MSAADFYTLDDLRRWSEVGASLQPPARVAVIGDPIAHSRSPQMHNPALAARGLDMQYVRVHVPVGEVKVALGLLAKNGFVGVNCTIPHKFEALEAMDVVDDLAEKLGAVNTVAIRENRLFGYNSDGPGFVNSMQEAFGCVLRELRVLVVGAGGGAGQAVALQLALKGCRGLCLANRSVEKLSGLRDRCRELNGSVPVETLSLEEVDAALGDVDLVVNATPMGMKEGGDGLFDFGRLRTRHFVYDMVYRAEGDTPLIAAAKEASAQTCDGLALLLHQGAISFGHWFGDPVPMEAMREGLRPV
ncbi:shikimate dehydrogenase [Phragmitibacter flavus]|uniref:Shikimate dehydrogenase (NADP(+)) n=1 Tax=Phragmitibacter flavus TaxID=2576071 RepID=A0A5R8KD65_9BACT|nr:shikimate dehydrogenase [Phragmitibacter flavus]TLD69865.1 shikimate dehydrogenase [Phragmitibacter flavus]